MNGRRTILAVIAVMLVSVLSIGSVAVDSDANVPDITNATYVSSEGAFLITLSESINGPSPQIVAVSPEGKVVAEGGGPSMSGQRYILLVPTDPEDIVPGRYVISLTDGSGSGTSVGYCDVPVPVTKVQLDKASLTLSVGSSYTFTVTISPEDATDKGVTWSSSDTSVVTVSPSGKITALKAGMADVTVRAVGGDCSATCAVTVTGSSPTPGPDPGPTYYTVTVETDGNGTAIASPKTATSGQTVTLTATPNEGYVFKEWQTSSGVSITGNTFTMPSKNVTVKAIFQKATIVADVSFDTTAASLEVGSSFQIVATIAPADAPDKTLVWATSDGSVVTVDNGLVKAVGPGTAKVTATTVSGKTAACTVTVTMTDIVIEADDGEISDSQISQIIDKVVPGQNVVLDSNGSDKLTVDVDAVLALLDKGAIVTIDTGSGSVEIPKGSLVSVPEGQPMVVTLIDTEIPEEFVGKVPEGSVVVDVTITVGDLLVTTFGTPITISLPVTGEVTDTSKLKVYHLADDGTMTDMDATYDSTTNSMVFQTEHLSVYAIVEETSAPSGDNDNTMLYIGIAIVVIVVIALAAVMLTRRH